MKTKKTGYWLSLISHAGIVVGLVYAAVQIQENTNAMRADAIQEASETARQQLMAVAENPELAQLLLTDFGDLSEPDQQRRINLARSYWIGMQNLFRQWELGVLPDEDWQVWYRTMCDRRRKVEQTIWSQLADLNPDFLATVEACLNR
ncbi:MAG: hypothetical protein R3192_02800 [Woeseiaceae bacterium]|nr:hypothetical protein [Woeseiaceae bacterium]